MQSHRSQDGTMEIEQGELYWKYETSSALVRHNILTDECLSDARKVRTGRPSLLFIHAGVTDHTLWDAQVAHFLDQGWNCLRFDIFGYGRSVPNECYLQSASRKPVDHLAVLDQLINEVLPAGSKVIPIGLSMGGSLALSYTAFYPQRIAGAIIVAGGVRGVEIPNTPQEDALFDQVDALVDTGNVQGAAEMQVRIWGDCPLQPSSRLASHLHGRMLAWNLDIAAREIAKTGAGAIYAVRREPAPATKLHEIQVPVLVAYGRLDETNTTGAMKYIGERIVGAEVVGFETAHMVNLEREDEFNGVVRGWLERWFEGGEIV